MGAAATGVYARVVVHLENVHVLKFQGKGFDLSASSSAPDGNSEYGSLNGATLRNCRAIYNGSHGFHIRGSDANACTFINCTAQLNGGWGFLDESALGNTYVGGEAATNSSGAYKCIGGVADSTYIGCYAEVGTGQAPDLSYRCIVNGGYLADHANQYNVGTNGNPTVLFAGGTQTPQLNFTTGQNEAVASAAGNAKLFRGADKGLILQGAPNVGGTFDVSILNKNAGQVMSVSTGTTQARFFGEVAVDFNGYFLNGPSAWAGAFGSNGSARMFATAAGGLQLYGQGSSYDVSVGNKVGGVALRVPTNTTNVEIVGTVSASNLSGTNSGDQFTSIAQNTVLGRTAAGPGAASALTTIPTAALPAMAGGDVTSAAGSTTLTIGAGAVSYSKIQNVSPARLIGNPSGTAAAPAEISLAGGLAFSGTTLTAAGALTPTSLASTGTVTSSGGAMGYATGAGGTVTQLTSKSTAVTVNKVSGQVTTHNASMAAAALVSFTVNNSAVAATDTINLNLASGNATAGTYRYWVEGIAAGVFKIVIENRSAGALAETLVFNFALLKAVNA